MSRVLNVFVAVVFSLSVLLTCIGYAAVSGELKISGSAEADMLPIYIRSATLQSGTGTVNLTEGMTMSATSTLSSSANRTVYKITVVNRTAQTYGYLATAADPTIYQNNSISYTLYSNAACTQKLERRTVLPPHANGEAGTLDFYLEVRAKTPAATATAYQFLLRFDFKTPIDEIPAPGTDTGAVAVDNAMTKFSEILNTDIPFDKLQTQMSDKDSENGRSSDSYIAYVPGTINGSGYTDDDMCLELFGGELNLIIDGTEYQVYFLLKRENVDNSSATGNERGEEYTLYMTTNPLTDSSSLFSKKSAVVYAGVFTSDDDGENWYQLGDMLTGSATICDYAGINASLNRGTGSFNTDSWKTTKAYYGVSTGKEVADVMSAKANDLTALRDAISRADAIISGEYYEVIYTEASRTRLESVLDMAKKINGASASYTQALVVSVTAELNKAISGLADAT